ncbi:hypothetical protein AB6A40_008402 [Gnathostoma spinigerum]|uniref:Uncharacterized protein n=1 Tax=Gnathostoma spinigerum TaxID=75299 RepID=A0ABD6EP96_9BILA
MVREEELVLESIAEDYPALIREALREPRDGCSFSASLFDRKYCCFIAERSLFIWQYGTQRNDSIPVRLQLPPCGLPYSVSTVCLYKKADSNAPGVLVVSPEGRIRHWVHLRCSFTETVIDLSGEVAYTVQCLDRSNSNNDNCNFLLSTTTGSLYILEIISEQIPSFRKKQRREKHSNINWRTLHKYAGRGLGSRISSLFFGSSTQNNARLVKVLICRWGARDVDDFDVSAGVLDNEVLSDVSARMYALIVRPQRLQLCCLETGDLTWETDVEEMLCEQFVQHLDLGTQSTRGTVTWIIDAIQARDGLVLLVAFCRLFASQKIHFGLAYFIDYDDTDAPTEVTWFNTFELLSSETFQYDSGQSLPLILQIPKNSIMLSHKSVEGILLFSPKSVHSIRLPDELTGAIKIPSIHFTLYRDTFISSACDSQYGYAFLTHKGTCRVRLLPKGFDASLSALPYAGSSVCDSGHSWKDSFESDYSILINAFDAFLRKDLATSSSILNVLLCRKNESVASLCVEYAVNLVDGKISVGANERPVICQDEMTSSAIPNEIEDQKRKAFGMFILFLRNLELDVKLNSVVHSCLSTNRTAISQLNELGEKLEIVHGLCQYLQENSTSYFKAAVSTLLRNRSSSAGDVDLALVDFIQEVSKVDELLPILIKVECDAVDACCDLASRMQVVDSFSSILLTFVEAVEQYRDEEPFSNFTGARWTQEEKILSALLCHLDLLFECLQQSGSGNISRIRDQAIVLSSFILGEQSKTARMNSSLIKKFLSVGEKQAAVELAERYEDFQTLIDLSLALPDSERRQKISEYKEMFGSSNFADFLHKYYIDHGKNSPYYLSEKEFGVFRSIMLFSPRI